MAIDLSRDDSLPRYILAVYELDSSWKEHARCRGRGRGAQRVWFQEDDHPGLPGQPPVTGHQLAEIALGECARCPVQWDCVTWAIRGEQNFCIYGDKAAARKWLAVTFVGDWSEEVELARVQQIPVRDLIIRLRREQAVAKKVVAGLSWLFMQAAASEHMAVAA